MLLPAAAQAGIFAREDFNYVNGILAGNHGGLGWAAAWSNAVGRPAVASGQGVINSVPDQQAARLISTLQQPPPGGSKQVWLAFEGRQHTNVNGNTATSSYGGLGLFRGESERLLIGKAWGADYQWRAGTGWGLTGTATPVSTLEPTKIVVRIILVDGNATPNDTLHVWLNPADTGSVAALGAPHITRTDADLSFDTLRLRGGEADATVIQEGWTFDAIAAGDTLAEVVASDSDHDGMLDAWETANGLIVGIDDSAGDPDQDGSPNLQEFQRSTHPQARDTDGDSLWDGWETGTGIYLNPTNTGTSPTLPDTDGDTLSDTREDNSGVFVDASNPGTNPNKADTDGDTHADGFEIARGSNPLSASSVPATGDLTLVGKDDFGGYAGGPDPVPVAGLHGGTGFDYDNTTYNNSFIGHTGTGSADWDDVFGTSFVTPGGKLVTFNSGAKREFNGPGEGIAYGADEHVGAVNEEANTAGRVIYFRADMRRGAGTIGAGITAYDFGEERFFAGVAIVPNPASGKYEFAIDDYAPDPVYSGIEAMPDRDYTLVVKLDYAADLMSFWVNPDLSGLESTPTLTTPFTMGNWTSSVRLASVGTAAVEWDNFIVAREWPALKGFAGVVPDFATWIRRFPAAAGAPGFNQDADGDGVSNGVENVLGTDPGVPTQGLCEVSGTAGAIKFRHTRSNAMATDVTAAYQWATNLQTWFASGQSGGGIVIVITANTLEENIHPHNDEVEVTATKAGSPPPRIFLRLKATRTAPPP